MGTLPTIKVKNEDGFMIINEADFDSKQHELFSEEEASSSSATTMEEAFKGLVEGNDTDFTSFGTPRVARIEELLGKDVSADDVKTAWEAFQSEE